MGKYKIDLHYECGHVQTKVLTYQHMRGMRYNGQRPIKVVCHFLPDVEFLRKSLECAMHPSKRLGTFVLVDGQEIPAKEHYDELKLMNVLEMI